MSLLDGTQFQFSINRDSLVRDVKLTLEKQTGIKKELQRLMFNGVEIKVRKESLKIFSEELHIHKETCKRQ